jgi:hypothetical protein
MTGLPWAVFVLLHIFTSSLEGLQRFDVTARAWIATLVFRTFGRARLATCARVLDRPDLPHDAEDLHEQASWWLGDGHTVRAGASTAPTSRLFPHAGIAVMISYGLQIVADADRLAKAPPATAPGFRSCCGRCSVSWIATMRSILTRRRLTLS